MSFDSKFFDGLRQDLHLPVGAFFKDEETGFCWYGIEFEDGKDGLTALCRQVEYFEFVGVRPVFIVEDAFPDTFVWPTLPVPTITPPESTTIAGPREEGVHDGWTPSEVGGMLALLPLDSYADSVFQFNTLYRHSEIAGIVEKFDCVVAAVSSYTIDLIPRRIPTAEGLELLKEYILQIGGSDYFVDLMTPLFWPCEFGR
jgi:hypothetical protein